MAKIRQLSPLEAQKIAAGEVVERPANVVKELLENALDAGATEITLMLEEGGKKCIQITDNGCGMSPEDARLSILHHATSKITSIDDLERLHTFGFRGEALSSIAAVSNLTITTREERTPAALSLSIAEGTITHESTLSARVGTEIIVKDLFYNVPARRKFLKTKETEWRTIAHLFQALCLTNLPVSFKLYHEERLIYNVPAVSTLSERIAQLFEPAFAKNCLSLSGTSERMNLKIDGAIGDHTYVRYDRSQIFLFVNNRWVKNHKLTQALIKGYQGILPSQRYPAGIVSITIDPMVIDINIHPRKEEIQFLHPRIVEELVESAAQESLSNKHAEQLGSAKPPTESAFPAANRQEFTAKPAQVLSPADFLDSFMKSNNPIQAKEDHIGHQHVLQNSRISPHHVITYAAQAEDMLLNYKLIGQLQRTYIMVEVTDGLVLIDQHAAHERITYERIRIRFEEIARVKLLFPEIIILTRDDADLIEPYIPLLIDFGIEAHRLSQTEIAIQETPVFLKNQSLEESIKQAISVLYEYDYLERHELKKIMQERVHAHISCKTAIKAGDELSGESMHEIIKDLLATENRLTCPHGRPTIWQLPISEVEKKFKRDYR